MMTLVQIIKDDIVWKREKYIPDEDDAEEGEDSCVAYLWL